MTDLAGLLGGAPPGPAPDTGPGAITSEHTGGLLDFVRQAIMSLQHFAEQSDDDVDIHAVTKCITALQGVIAGHAKDRESALGMSPALRTVKRASSGY